MLLDAWPFTGHTTTMHALWMGVPVLTLAGRTHVSRRGMGIAGNLQLQQWVASSPPQWIERGKALCGDLDRLADLREPSASACALPHCST